MYCNFKLQYAVIFLHHITAEKLKFGYTVSIGDYSLVLL